MAKALHQRHRLSGIFFPLRYARVQHSCDVVDGTAPSNAASKRQLDKAIGQLNDCAETSSSGMDGVTIEACRDCCS